MRADPFLLLCRTLCAVALSVLAACGGSSVETTIIGEGVVVVADQPTGPNTTEIVIDTGPSSGFSLGAVNVPYVTVTVCAPGSTTACTTIDHVFVDTGSYGLRIFDTAVASLNLPALGLPADAATSTPAGPGAECYPFVLGAVWGSMAQADVHIGGETAPSLPIQLIASSGAAPAAPADCTAAANGALMNSPAALQANGILGIGMVRYDCGLQCVTGNYAGGHVLYYACPQGGCVPAAVPQDLQLRNPIVSFLPDADRVVDDNGSIIVLPAVPETGATKVRGRLVFGIGTRSNNQLPLSAKVLPIDTNTSSASYLEFATTVGAAAFPNSYMDSGSNALFFDDASISRDCKSSTGTASAGWYCPASPVRATATLTGSDGTSGTVDFSIASADALFAAGNVAYANLGGTAGQGAATFVWGLPFFYGRTVFTSIWGQTLSAQGPWNAF
jgi:hypothetical protein